MAMGATPWLFTGYLCPQRLAPAWPAWRHAVVLSLVLLLNVADGWLTLHIVLTGAGWEQNPLMRGLLAEGPGYFLGTKLFLCGASLALLWRARQRVLAHLVAIAAAVIYGTAVAYQLLNLAR